MISYIRREPTEVFEDTVVVEPNGIGTISAYRGSVLDPCRPLAVPYGLLSYMSKKMR